MALKQSRLRYLLFFVGVLVSSLGFGILIVQNRFTYVALLCILIGLLSITYNVCQVRFHQRINPIDWTKGLKLGLGLVFFLVLIAGINYLGCRYNYRLDVTKFKQHTLLEETVNRIESLKHNVQFTAFHVGIAPKYLEDMFQEYERLSEGKIVGEIIDPLVQIGYAAQFGQVINGQEKKVFVQSGKERREIDFTKKTLTQEALNNAMVQVTRKVRRACFLTGHGENRLFEDEPTGLSKFSKHLLANNIIGKEVALDLQGGLSDSCDVLVIAGPRNHLTVKEEKIIQTYLENGGDALFLIENVIVSTPDKPLTDEQKAMNPSLNNILRNWGIKVANDVVVDLDSHASGDVGSPATRRYMAHRAIVNNLDYTFFIRPRSIKMLRDRKPTTSLAPLILTGSDEKSWGETNRYLKIKFDPEEDRAGPVPIAFAVMDAKDDPELSNMRMIVITDADFISNAYVDSYSNAQLGINALSWLSDLEYETYLDQSLVDVTRLDLTSLQKRSIAFILFLIPCFVISAGLFIWMRQSIV